MNQREIGKLYRERSKDMPEWFSPAGLTMIVEHAKPAERQGIVVLSNIGNHLPHMKSRLVVTPEGKNPWHQPTWRLHWAVSYRTVYEQIETHGTMVITESELRGAFRLPKGATRNAASMANTNDYGGWGTWKRSGNYLNLPVKNGMHGNTPSVSVFLTEEIQTALYQLIATRRARESVPAEADPANLMWYEFHR